MSDEITPITRREMFYDNILGASNVISPITREEIYLNEIAGNTEETASSKVDWDSLGILGPKNLLSLDLSTLTALNTTGTWSSNTYTHEGITYTVNSDMTITASGTATADSSFIVLSNYTQPALDVILSCTPEDGSETTYYTEIVIDSEDYSDIGEGLEIASDSDPITSTTIIIKDGEEITDLVFSPMIRLATDTDTTYRPYAMTNRELTEKTTDLDNRIAIKEANNRIATTTDFNAGGDGMIVDLFNKNGVCVGHLVFRPQGFLNDIALELYSDDWSTQAWAIHKDA